ncbi:tape measure protein [Pseudomonas sp.]|uniref:tape measure protein n=1 Tax=Pseudomonas sp. TaxID=306 RepID=UPI0028AF423F|nr:tape measure protein [Pseudomonas sp.]
MALKSRLELEVDGRTAEQQVNTVRIALEALTQVGLRAAPALASVFSSVNSSLNTIAAATARLNAAQNALNNIGAAGSRASAGLSGASSSLSTTSANAAAAEARLAAATRAMNDLQQTALKATAALNGVGGSVTVSTRNAAGAVGGLNSSMGSLRSMALSLAGPLLGLFGGAQLTRSVYEASEAYSTLTNRLRLVTAGAEELATAQQSVFTIAQAARQPLNSTAELYQRIATNQKELNLTGQGVADVVGTISKTLAISGASAASANAALVQLGQAFASGTLRGEELNSVMEQAPALAQAIAAGMGKTVGELRTLGAAGLLTADSVVKALQSQEGAVEELFKKTSTTIGQALTATGNSFTQLVGKLDQASQASQSISAEILSISRAMDSLTISNTAAAETLKTIGVLMGGAAAAGAVLLVNKIGVVTYAYFANRAAAIALAEAELNAANADRIKAQTATILAEREALAARGTAAQTIAAVALAETRMLQAKADAVATASAERLAVAQRTVLASLAGPAGIAIAVGTVAASWLLMRDNNDQATKALDDHGLKVDQVVEKYSELNNAQKRVKLLDWADKQSENITKADKALASYVDRVQEGIVSGYFSKGIGDLTGEFNSLIAEVRSGQRDLDSVTEWLTKSIDLNPRAQRALANTASEYSGFIGENERLAKILGEVDGKQDATAEGQKRLAAAQSGTTGQTRAQLAEWQKYIAKLTETRDLLGANEAAEAKYRAAKMGLTAEQTKQAEVVASQIDTLKKYQDAIKENDKVQQAALKAQLVALYTQQQAAEDAAAAVKKSHEDAAKAAQDSANMQIAQMQRVIDKAINLTKGRNLLLAPEQAQQNLSGYGLLTNGGTPPVAGPAPRKTPQQLADEATAQIRTTTDVNKSATRTKTKTVREDAGQKMLDDARQRYAVLQQQSREIEAQGTSTRTLGAEAKKLIELETEISTLKTKGTLTTTQKQVLAMAELNLAQQKQNAALETANELTKERLANQAKLAAFQENLNSQLELSREGQANELAGAGQSDRVRQRLQEDLKIRQDYQKQIDKLSRDYNRLDNPNANDTALYEGETQALRAALATRMVDQQNYYVAQDEMRAQWLTGVSESWQNYVDMATDYNSQARAATESILSDTTSSISDSIQGIIKGTESLGDAFGNLASTMANSVLGALADIAAQWLVVQALKMAGITAETTATVAAEGTKTAVKVAADATATASSLAATATTTSAQVAAAGTTAAAWLPAALVASIGSFGAAAVVGGAALVAAYALIKGFSGGGYTGAGGVNEPAGIVHKGEVVWSQADVRRFGGVAAVEGLRTGNVAPTSSAQSGGRTQSASSGSGAGGGSTASVTPIHQVFNIGSDVSEQTVAMVQQGMRQTMTAILQDVNRNGQIMQTIRKKI